MKEEINTKEKMEMSPQKKKYYALIEEFGVADVLSLIEEIPYTAKLVLMKELLNKFRANKVTLALEKYKRDYIDLGRVNLGRMKNILIRFCQSKV